MAVIGGGISGLATADILKRSGHQVIVLERQNRTVRGTPVVHQVRHWPRGLPQNAMGHADRVARIEAAGLRMPGLYLTGNYINGVSVADCLTKARTTAADVNAFLERDEIKCVRPCAHIAL